MPTSAKQRTLKSYRAGRLSLIAAMGGACEQCGTTDDLQFHHTRPRTWIARNVNRWVRLANYKREHAAGLLLLLCGVCNRQAGEPGVSDF